MILIPKIILSTSSQYFFSKKQATTHFIWFTGILMITVDPNNRSILWMVSCDRIQYSSICTLYFLKLFCFFTANNFSHCPSKKEKNDIDDKIQENTMNYNYSVYYLPLKKYSLLFFLIMSIKRTEAKMLMF